MRVAFDDYTYDFARRELRRNGLMLKLDPILVDLLACLLARPGTFVSKQELMTMVWDDRVVSDNLLSVTVAKLRRALGRGAGGRVYIESRYGRGYRIVPEITVLDEPATEVPAKLPNVPTLVGRTDSLSILMSALEEAFDGRGAVCIVTGEPGIGKTRLAETFAHGAREHGAAVLWGRWTHGDGAPALWPFTQVLREMRGSRLADKVLRTVALIAERETAPTDSTTVRVAMSAALNEVCQGLSRLSSQQRLSIVLEDLQWADQASLRLLETIADDIGRWPLLLLITLRKNELAVASRRGGSLSRLLLHPNSKRIELGRLEASEVDALVTETLGAPHERLSRIIFRRSEGNPFFATELLRAWKSRSELDDPESLELPSFALDLVRQRIRALSPDTRHVLSAAAVVGRVFDLTLLHVVTGSARDALFEALDGALASGIVTPLAEMPGRYSFDLELSRSVLYGDLPMNDRCRLHLRTGDALVRALSCGRSVEVTDIAAHYLSALPQGEPRVAIAYAREAAAAAQRRGATAQARTLLRRAIDSLALWVETDSGLRAQLLRELSNMESTR